MQAPNFSSLLFFLFLVCKALAALELDSYSDGSYYWSELDTADTHPSADKLRSVSESMFEQMKKDATHRGIEKPNCIAALWAPNKGIIVASSIVGSPGKQSAGTQDLNVCSNRYHGNCAEMNAIALAQAHSWPIKGGAIAVYGHDKHSNSDKHLSPCKDANGKDGCEGKLEPNGVRPITKRSVVRIEFTA